MAILRLSRVRHGFSFLEVVLTVAVISILATTVIVTVSPSYFLGKTRNAQRWTYVDELIDAVAAFTIDHDGYTPPNIQIPPVSGTATFSGAYVIETNYNSAKAVVFDDIDDDGALEIFGTASLGNNRDVSMWEYSGIAPNFTWIQTTIDQSNWKGEDIAAGDIDGDGLRDIASVNRQSRTVAWWRNLGGAPATFDARRNMTTNFNGIAGLALADIDNATKMDVAVVSSEFINGIFNPVRWYENDGTPLDGGWNTINIESWNLSIDRQVITVDIDQDTDQDVIVAEQMRLFSNEYIYLYVNDGTPEGANWTRVTVDDGENGLRGVAAADIDGDLDVDIVGIGLSGKVEWYENDGTPLVGSPWVHHEITASFGGETVRAADLDNDGDSEVVAASIGGDKLAYWENLGGGSFSGTFVIGFGSSLNGVSDIDLGDLDEDGDLDIVTANDAARTISWWENLAISGSSDPAPQGAIDADYKPICREGVTVPECDAYGGVALDVLIPGYLATIPVDPSQDESSATGSVLTGLEIRIDTQLANVSIRAPFAELGEVIEIIGPVGTENCLVWDVLQGQRTCVLFE
ncbi:MAG TPA: VCBS repeat-containing protein [Candidatus Peribacterales bacterium]|nr:VCBS repeat-containing protein [Candidatus Peribacterales bacterium]